MSNIILTSMPLDFAPIEAKKLSEEKCLSEGWFDERITAQIKSEKWETRLLRYLRTETNKLKKWGRHVRIVFSPSDPAIIQGA